MVTVSRITGRIAVVGAFALVALCPVFGQESSSKPHNLRSTETASAAASVPQKTSAVHPQDSSAPALKDEYKIGVEDELQITVWREPELSGQVAVRPDGVITLPLLQEVKVVGYTTNELRDVLTEKLKAYLTEPQVTVVVRAIRSRKVYLVGNTSRPGAYQLNGRKTVLQLLAEAGGLGPFSKSKGIYVMREQNGRKVKIPFNYKKALSDATGTSDVELMPGDMIVVP